MKKKSDLFYLFKDLTDALKTKIDSKYIFEGKRPDITDESMKFFVVIESNVTITDLAAGRNGFHFVSGGSFRLFVKAKKDGTLNLEKTSDLIDDIHSLFPIRGERWSAVKPIDRIVGYDGLGFCESCITFDLHSK